MVEKLYAQEDSSPWTLNWRVWGSDRTTRVDEYSCIKEVGEVAPLLSPSIFHDINTASLGAGEPGPNSLN